MPPAATFFGFKHAGNELFFEDNNKKPQFCGQKSNQCSNALNSLPLAMLFILRDHGNYMGISNMGCVMSTSLIHNFKERHRIKHGKSILKKIK